MINEALIAEILERNSQPDESRISEVLTKAMEMKGLDSEDVAVLMNINTPDQLATLFESARQVKDDIYGRRLVVFAPLYVSNLCANECLYCAFRVKNDAIVRRALTQKEIAEDTKVLIDQGHKRVLLVAGEAYPKQGFQYILDAIDSVYSVKSGNGGEIRRVNVNVAPLSVEDFKRLKNAKIGTYQIFQETYHRETYAKVHTMGKKRDYDYRLEAIDRAMEAGIDDVGIGVLFGLADWKFETLALMQHIKHLEDKFGVGPHTLSVPRLEPATGADLASDPPMPVSDIDFRKLVAILRLAVPYTGIIMSTRETAEMRKETYALGVSQISAGSRTNPGGYADEEEVDSSQFSLGDHRSLDEVIRSIAKLGYIPSFCTGCYRLGRTGADFMDLAKPGDIKTHCAPNAVSTFQEYLMDYASPETAVVGNALIDEVIETMDNPIAAARAKTLREQVISGKHDVYC